MSSHKPIPNLTKSDLERFWSKVDKGAPDDCWLWTGTISNKYGQFTSRSGNRYLAHRVSYAIANGDPWRILCLSSL